MIILIFLEKVDCFCVGPGVHPFCLKGPPLGEPGAWHSGPRGKRVNEFGMDVRTFVAVFIFMGVDYLLGLLR